MVGTAVCPGRVHRLHWRNGQDAALAHQIGPELAFGLVLDGCGAKAQIAGQRRPSHNEVGAHLLGHYLAGWLSRALPTGPSALEVVGGLGEAAASFLGSLVELVSGDAEREMLARTQLLCTIVGFVVRPGDALVFWIGDGLALLDETAWRLDSPPAPDYAAHSLLDGVKRFPVGFMVRDRAGLRRLAVASDGWQPDLLADLPGPCTSLELGRWVNRHAAARDRFADDGAVAVWWADRPS